MVKMTGIVILIGSIVFLIAAFMPITTVFVIERNVAEVQSRLGEWAASLLLFGLGGAIAMIGMGLLTLQLRGENNATSFGYLGFAVLLLGTICWGVILYLRYTLPLEIVFRERTFGAWFVAYTLLTQGALMAYGYALLKAGYPRWLGLATLGLTTLSIAAYIIFKDVPPLAHYIITLVIGGALLFWKEDETTQKSSGIFSHRAGRGSDAGA